MIAREKIIEILRNNSQKSTIGWAVEEDDFGAVADEMIKNSVSKRQLLESILEWYNDDPFGEIGSMSYDKAVKEYLKTL